MVFKIKLNPRIFNKLKDTELSMPMIITGIITYKKRLLIFGDWDPTVGKITKAIKSDDDKTATKVMGMYFIKPPVTPGQNNNGINTAIVVKVEAIIGSDILDDAFK